jgi:hypothetical protein
MCLQCTLVRSIPTIILPHPPSPNLKWFQQISLFYFIQVYKVYQPYSPSFTLSIYPPFPINTLPPTGSVLPSCPSLFKSISVVQRGFALAFHPWMYCTLIRLTPSITLPYPFHNSHYPTVFSAFHYAIFLYRCNVFLYYSLSVIFFSSCSSH